MNRNIVLLGLLAGCPSSGNDHVLWLAPDQMETAVKLVGDKPHTF